MCALMTDEDLNASMTVLDTKQSVNCEVPCKRRAQKLNSSSLEEWATSHMHFPFPSLEGSPPKKQI